MRRPGQRSCPLTGIDLNFDRSRQPGQRSCPGDSGISARCADEPEKKEIKQKRNKKKQEKQHNDLHQYYWLTDNPQPVSSPNKFGFSLEHISGPHRLPWCPNTPTPPGHTCISGFNCLCMGIGRGRKFGQRRMEGECHHQPSPHHHLPSSPSHHLHPNPEPFRLKWPKAVVSSPPLRSEYR